MSNELLFLNRDEKCDECKKFIHAVVEVWLAPTTAAGVTDYLNGEAFCQNPDNGFIDGNVVAECQAGITEFMPIALNVLFGADVDAAGACNYYFNLCKPPRSPWWKV